MIDADPYLRRFAERVSGLVALADDPLKTPAMRAGWAEKADQAAVAMAHVGVVVQLMNENSVSIRAAAASLDMRREDLRHLLSGKNMAWWSDTANVLRLYRVAKGGGSNGDVRQEVQ